MRDTLVKNSISGKSIQFTSTNTLSCDFLDKTLSSLGPVSSNFTLQGSINHTLTESAVQLRIRELKNNDITVKPVEAAFWYTDEKLNLQILENVGSFNLFAEYTISKKEFDILLETEKFNPLSLLTIKKPSPLIKKIEGTALSGVYSMNGSLENIKALTYTAKGSISVPSSLVPRGLDVKIEAEGNLSFADITTLHISGPLCDIEYTGSIDIKNIQPQGYLSVNSYTLPNSNIIQAEMYLIL